MLLAARDEDGSQMTDRQLRDEAITLFLAVTRHASTLSWTWWLCAESRGGKQSCMRNSMPSLAIALPLSMICQDSLTREHVITESLRLYRQLGDWRG